MIDSPKQIRRWRDKAEEIRMAVGGWSDPEARRTMLRVAETYDRLANEVQARRSLHLSQKPETG